MSFDVSTFLSAVNKVGGLQSPAKFHVRIFPRFQSNNRLLEYFCDSVIIPGVTIASTPVKPLGYGYTRDAALSPIYQGAQLTFLDDNAKLVSAFVFDWQNRVVESRYEPGGALQSTGELQPFQLGYLDDFAARVVVTTFDQDGRVTSVTNLHDAYPSSVADQRFSWDSINVINRITVPLSYSSMTQE